MLLTVKEVAQRLNLPAETVHRWIRQGKIPMQYHRDGYTIRSEMLARWADEHKLDVQLPAAAVRPVDEPEFDGILPAMHRGGVFYDVEGHHPDSVLRSAVALIPDIDPGDRDLVHQALLEREQLASTGIGNGIALPHPRTTPGIALALPRITTCFLARPVEYGAIDGRPVSILMILLSCSTKQHVTMLSKLSYYLRNATFRELLLGRPEQTAIFNALSQIESRGE